MPIPRRTLLRAGLLAAAAGCTATPARRAALVHRSGTARTPTAAGAPPHLGPEVVNGPRHERAVALTFHGSGDPAITLRVLDEAAAAHAAITVLAVGTWLESNPTLAGRIRDGGHDLGNHTYTHPVLPQLDAAATYAEITGCARVLRRLTGSVGRWFRPSGTQHATRLIEAQARRAGYPTCLSYDVDPLDYTDPGASVVARRVLDGARPGSIVSLHLGHAGTAAALPTIFEGLHAARLRPVTVSALLGVPT